MKSDASAQWSRNRFASAIVTASVLLVGLLVGGCASTGSPAEGDGESVGLLLAGPSTNIMVSIPEGWHQVINSANPITPQMVAPTTCLGANELSCASGLARIGTVRAKSIEDAAKAVGGVVTSGRGVVDVATLSQGPGKLGKRDGFRHRFTFRDSASLVTAEVAAVPSGPTTPDSVGNSEFSVVLVWVKDTPAAPKVEVIDRIVNSTLVHGGVPAP